MSTIVVGVDGSEASAHALRWALDEARLRRAKLQIVYAYEFAPAWRFYPDEAGLSGAQFEALSEDYDAAAEESRRHGEELVAGMVAALGDLGEVQVDQQVTGDHRPASALIEATKGAELVVVGSRGRGGFKGLLLGSVSQQVATHAHCPVVILGQHLTES